MKVWQNLQRGGMYGRPLLSNALRADKEITRALNLVNILRLAGSDTGVGRHKIDLAVDYQGGIGNNPAHQAIADYALKNWKRLGIRYMAWNGHEYISSHKGAVPTKRAQVVNYGGSDPFHRNHVHIDWWDNGANGAKPDIEIGAAFKAAAPTASPHVLAMLKELEYGSVVEAQKDLGLVQDGVAGPITTTALEAEMSKIDRLIEDSDKLKAATQRNEQRLVAVLSALSGVLDTLADADLPGARRRAEQTNAAAGRIEKEIGTYGQEKGA